MPFAVFRRHQKKLLAVLAIFAMVAFTLDFSLFKNKFGRAAEDTLIVKLDGRNIYRSDLAEMMAERARANRFMTRVSGRPEFFGGLNNRAMVDALILQREADRLRMPAKAEQAIKFLKQVDLTTQRFNEIYHDGFDEEVTDDQLLTEIANQIRLLEVSGLPGMPVVTPLDIFQAYRDQYEKISAHAVPFYVEDYADKVPDPTDSELRSEYERYKNVLPDPDRDTPGFKIPRRVQAEFVSLDGRALAAEWKAKLTEAELRDAYELRAKEFPLEAPELPLNVFAGDPKAMLTPRLRDPFLEVKPLVASTLAEERAQDEINQKFDELKDKTMQEFYDRYDQIASDNKDAADQGRAPAPLPEPGDLLKKAAARLGLKYTQTELLDRQDADRYPNIGGARIGTGQSSGGKSFAEAFFEAKSPLYDPSLLADDLGQRYVAWKIRDLPARIPPFEETRTRVLAAWKLEKARALAQGAAKTFADRVRAANGNIKQVAGSRLTITTEPVAKLQPDVSFTNPLQFGRPRPTEIPRIPRAGAELRQKYFGLRPQSVAIAPNEPKTIYYVLTLNQAYPVDVATLYSPFGPQMTLRTEVFSEALTRRRQEWMGELRRRAGLKPDWVPPDEARHQETASNG